MTISDGLMSLMASLAPLSLTLNLLPESTHGQPKAATHTRTLIRVF